MTLVLALLAIVSLLEILTWALPLRQLRKVWAMTIGIALAALSVALIAAHLAVWSLAVLFFSAYRIINLLRLVKGQTEPKYLSKVARQTSYWLIGCQLIVLGAARLAIPAETWIYGLAVLQLSAAFVLSASTRRHLRTTRPPATTSQLTAHDLPALTVAIPARNESQDLTACLQSLVASDYRKLEILVLDDCSQNKRTADIIRSFAHTGVRFIAGQVPPGHWLAKNYAYQQLAEAANGEVLLFCGVDTRFQPQSLSLIVESLLTKKKSVISFIPRNALSASNLGSLFVQPSRYAWELALPRRWLNRPPVLSTCWLITKETLKSAGGFQAVARNISPESYFARYVLKKDGYSFLQSDPAIGLSSTKTFDEQRATAVRTRYPQLHRRPELAALLSLTEFATLVAPYVLLIVSAANHQWLLAGISLLASLELTSFYGRIVQLTYRKFLLRGLGLLPFAALYDIGLLNYSMWQYEFNEVIWKGRNICLPVMRITASLPKLETEP